jgi:hypothetical protein
MKQATIVYLSDGAGDGAEETRKEIERRGWLDEGHKVVRE